MAGPFFSIQNKDVLIDKNLCYLLIYLFLGEERGGRFSFLNIPKIPDVFFFNLQECTLNNS